jgi:hypothetical protein
MMLLLLLMRGLTRRAGVVGAISGSGAKPSPGDHRFAFLIKHKKKSFYFMVPNLLFGYDTPSLVRAGSNGGGGGGLALDEDAGAAGAGPGGAAASSVMNKATVRGFTAPHPLG